MNYVYVVTAINLAGFNVGNRAIKIFEDEEDAADFYHAADCAYDLVWIDKLPVYPKKEASG